MRFDTDIYARTAAGINSPLEAWQNLVDTCTEKHIFGWLMESSESDWLVHMHHFNLYAQLEFIERNGLDSMLIAENFGYPLAEIESSEATGWVPLVEAYKRYIELRGPQLRQYGMAEKFVHIKCRQAIRKTLELPPLSQTEIDAFFIGSLPTGPDRMLSPHEPTDDMDAEFSRKQMIVVAEFIKQHMPSVAAYVKAMVHKSEVQGYGNTSPMSVHSNSTPMELVDSTTSYFLTTRTWTIRKEIVELVAEM